MVGNKELLNRNHVSASARRSELRIFFIRTAFAAASPGACRMFMYILHTGAAKCGILFTPVLPALPFKIWENLAASSLSDEDKYPRKNGVE